MAHAIWPTARNKIVNIKKLSVITKNYNLGGIWIPNNKVEARLWKFQVAEPTLFKFKKKKTIFEQCAILTQLFGIFKILLQTR